MFVYFDKYILKIITNIELTKLLWINGFIDEIFRFYKIINYDY